MADPIRAFAEAESLGRVERRIPLKGRLEIPGGRHAAAELMETTRGGFLVGASDGRHGVAIDLSRRPDLRYERGRLSDSLHLGELRLGIPTGRGESALEIIARARLGVAGEGRAAALAPSRYVETPSARAAAWLAQAVPESEPLLSWLATDSELPVESPVLGETTARAHLLLTPSRAALVAISDAGDVRVDELERRPLRVEGVVGRREVVSAAHRWKSTLTNAELWQELARAPATWGAARCLEMARAARIDGGDDDSIARSREWIAHAATADAVARAVLRMIAHDDGQPAAPPVPTPSELRGTDDDALAARWAELRLSPEAGLELVAALRKVESEPWALRLHSRVHARLRELRDDRQRLAEADLALAEHLISRGRHDAAVRLLEQRLSELPSEALEELLPPRDADLTRGAGGQQLRIACYELLSRARRGAGRDDTRSVTELARLQPLVLERVERLAAANAGDASTRAHDILRLLSPGGLAQSEERAGGAPEIAGTLGDEGLLKLLRHPVVRDGGALLGRLQALLAVVPVPDRRALRDFVEPIDPGTYPAAARALSAAAKLLGVERLEGYVSRGRKAVGVRSYDGPPPFVLIGHRHLLDGDAAHLTERELCFAIGAEVAHLRFGHSRVTSSEVWAGAWSKSKQGLDFALGVMPLLKGWRFFEQAQRTLSRIPTSALQRAVGEALALKKRLDDPVGEPATSQHEGLTALNEQLVAAHRVMQLTADRAGLVLCADPRAAVRAMLLVRPDLLDLLSAVERDGIEAVLAERDEDGRMEHQDLAVRVAALLSFHLSDEADALRAAASR